MAGLITALPDQLRAVPAEVGAQIAQSGARPGLVIAAGMGGSAIAADCAAAISAEAGAAAVIPWRNYGLPTWAGDDAMFVAISYSGNTEETLSGYAAARERQLRRFAITSGGELAAMCAEDNVPVYSIPEGQPPRTALGWLLMPLLEGLSAAGVLQPALPQSIDETAEALHRLADELAPYRPSRSNPAKLLALRFWQALPVVYGVEPLCHVAAYRWKCQLNENAKMLAISGGLPEQNHNEVLAWGRIAEQAPNSFPVWLRTTGPFGDSRMTQRVEATRRVLGSDVDSVEVRACSGSSLTQLLWLCLYGDFVSLYCALLGGVDPTAIGAIDALKLAMSKA